MSVVSNSVTVRASLDWRLSKAVAGFQSPTQQGGLSGAQAVDTTVFTSIYTVATTTVAAAGTLTLNFRDVVEMLGDAVVGANIMGVMITATATVTGGVLRVQPHATNGLTWPFSGTSPALSLAVGTAGAGLLLWQGMAQTVGASTKQWLLTNTGTQTISVTVAAVIGP